MNAFTLPSFAALASAAALAGCASTQLDAQWTDPQRGVVSLRGARVLVACEAVEAVIKRLCLDRLAEEVVARGATPVIAPQSDLERGPLRAPNDEPYLAAARAAGARAVLAASVAPTTTRAGPGFSVGLGGFGSIGAGGYGGIGVSAPIGGGRRVAGYSANARITHAESGRLLWTARASSPPSSDVNSQLAELAHTVLEGAGSAGLF
jgi:hypothetical protein